jgi:hypothetical protein
VHGEEFTKAFERRSNRASLLQSFAEGERTVLIHAEEGIEYPVEK